MGDLVGAVLFAVLFPLGMWALFRFSRRAPEVDGDSVVLRYGPAVAVLGWLCLLMGGMMLGAILSGQTEGDSMVAVGFVGVVGLGFVVGGAWFLRAHRSETIRFSPSGIEGRSGWGRPVSLGWADIEHVRFRPLMGYLVLRSREDRVVRVSPLMSGTDELVSVLERRIQADGVAEAVGAFRQSRAAYGGGSKR